MSNGAMLISLVLWHCCASNTIWHAVYPDEPWSLEVLLEVVREASV